MTAALAITAFDHTTSKITIPAHGLATGTGPCALMCVGGVLPAGPGFAPVTDYFVINVDANTIQLASSSTNAFNGVPIAFADNGTGTATLLIGIPFRRPRTHTKTIFNLDGTVQVPGTQIFSADLNDNYDTWAAYWALMTGQPQTLLDGPTFAGPVTVGGALLPFADFTFTADSTTDICTAANHPLHTGAGPIRTSNTGGGLPGGLAAATDYFAIKLSSSTFKLATSQANALAGTAIDITTNGTGTQTVNHQPTTARISDVTVTRNLTVTGKVTAGQLTHGTQTLIVDGTEFQPITSSTTVSDRTNGCTFNGGTGVQAPIQIPVGRRITAVRFNIKDSATGPSVLQGQRRSRGPTGTMDASPTGDITAGSAGSGANQTISTSAIRTITANAFLLQVTYFSGTASCTVYSAEIDYDFL